MINSVYDSDHYDELCLMIAKRVSGFAIKYKDESRWQGFLGWLCFFNKKYMTTYTSTFGKTVWFPSRKFVEKNKWVAFKILAHEYVHLLDRDKARFVFEFSYVFPHFMFVFSLLAFLSIRFSFGWLFSLLFLLFLLPIPAVFRAAVEMRGYSMNIAINIWRHGSLREDTREWIVEVFTGWPYYKMWPFPSVVREWIADIERRVYNIDAVKTDPEDVIINDSEAFVDVYALVTGIELE